MKSISLKDPAKSSFLGLRRKRKEKERESILKRIQQKAKEARSPKTQKNRIQVSQNEAKEKQQKLPKYVNKKYRLKNHLKWQLRFK